MEITAEYLRERLDYNPETGIFVWKAHPNFPTTQVRLVGTRAGSVNNEGYRQIRVNGGRWEEHRLAWLYIHGEMPDNLCIDHINMDRGDNRISNLRLATNGENNQNRAPQSNNKLGVKNVSAQTISGNFAVSFHLKGERLYFGTYKTLEEAAAVANRERKRLHGEFARAA